MREQRITTLVAIILSVAVIGLYGYTFLTIERTNENIWQAAEELEEGRQKKDALIELQALLEQTADSRAELEQYILSQNEIIGFLSELESLGEQITETFNIASVSIEGEALEESEDVREVLEVRFSASGTFESLYYLLQLIEVLPYEVSVNEAIFTRPQTESGVVRPWGLSATIHVTSFIRDGI